MSASAHLPVLVAAALAGPPMHVAARSEAAEVHGWGIPPVPGRQTAPLQWARWFCTFFWFRHEDATGRAALEQAAALARAPK